MSIAIAFLLTITGLPASFTGDLPCADCEAIRYHVDLFEDGTYFRRVVYVGRSTKGIDEIGKWTEDGDTVVLSGGEKLDLKRLVRTPTFAPIEPELTLRGTYAVAAEAGAFTECTTGLQMPVAREGASPMLEAAYARVRPSVGESVFIAVDGKIAMRPNATLVVNTLQTVGAGDCAGTLLTALAGTSLEDTYWKLVTLGNQTVAVPDGQREPHLILQSMEHRVVGFAGCNRMLGDYKVDGERLEFEGVAGTMLACPGGMDSERAFHQALRDTFGYRIDGEELTLLDQDGKPLAELQSRDRE